MPMAWVRGMPQQPLDGDGARAAANVPQQLAGTRPERGERHGPDLALGDLAVMLEHVVGQPRGERDDLGARACLDLDGDEVQRLDIVEAETIGGGAAHALAWATQGFEHMQRRPREAARAEIARDRGRCGRIGGEREHAALRLERRRKSLDRPAAERHRGNIVKRPAEPCASQATATTAPARKWSPPPAHGPTAWRRRRSSTDRRRRARRPARRDGRGLRGWIGRWGSARP